MKNIPSGIMDENVVIGILGQGYVGLPLAMEFSKNNKVIGFDTCPEPSRICMQAGLISKTLQMNISANISVKHISRPQIQRTSLSAISSSSAYRRHYPTTIFQTYIVHGSPALGMYANTRIGGEPLLACHQQGQHS